MTRPAQPSVPRFEKTEDGGADDMAWDEPTGRSVPSSIQQESAPEPAPAPAKTMMIGSAASAPEPEEVDALVAPESPKDEGLRDAKLRQKATRAGGFPQSQQAPQQPDPFAGMAAYREPATLMERKLGARKGSRWSVFLGLAFVLALIALLVWWLLG